jgi:hypothetical protein
VVLQIFFGVNYRSKIVGNIQTKSVILNLENNEYCLPFYRSIENLTSSFGIPYSVKEFTIS